MHNAALETVEYRIIEELMKRSHGLEAEDKTQGKKRKARTGRKKRTTRRDEQQTDARERCVLKEKEDRQQQQMKLNFDEEVTSVIIGVVVCSDVL